MVKVIFVPLGLFGAIFKLVEKLLTKVRPQPLDDIEFISETLRLRFSVSTSTPFPSSHNSNKIESSVLFMDKETLPGFFYIRVPEN